MARLHSFVFSPLAENTYVLYDESGEAVIIDPGCYTEQERTELSDFIAQNNLKPVKLLNTHAHIDHILGNAFVKRKYGIDLYLHQKDLEVLRAAPLFASLFGLVNYEETEVDHFLVEGEPVSFGQTRLDVVFLPGHAPGHVGFVNHADRFVISGDALFRGSVGRTDFPHSDHETLLHSIRTQLYTLPDDYTVYAGHMGATTIGAEKKTNPFVRA